MPRYFIEVSYKGTAYSGFQIQNNAVTIQSELEKALKIFLKKPVSLTGSSRTDAGVHAMQNYFHFDLDEELEERAAHHSAAGLENTISRVWYGVYNLNAILPNDIVVKRVFKVMEEAHCRFDAVAREYKYYIYSMKNAFLLETAYYFPYTLNIELLNEAAAILMSYTDFTSFSKRNTQVNNFNCAIRKSEWLLEEGRLVYNVKGNRFLRGMVKGLVGTMLKVGIGKLSIEGFKEVIEKKDCTLANFSVPSHALFLIEVEYPK